MSITIVIQGPTNFCHQIVPTLPIKDYEIVWSTWESEDENNINYIRDNKINVLQNTKPYFFGVGNLNLQSYSTLKGIQASNGNYILKIRPDLIIENYKKFFNILLSKKDKLTFLCWHQHRGGYPVDYICFGEKTEIKLYWDFIDNKNEYFAEYLLYRNYCFKKNILMSEYTLKNNFNYFLYDIQDNLNIKWLKYNLYLNDYIKDNLYRVNK